MVLANYIVLKIEEKDNLGVEDCVKRSSLLLQFCMLPLVIVITNSDQFSSQSSPPRQALLGFELLHYTVCIVGDQIQ